MAWTKEQQREYYRQWAANNRDRLREHQRKWREANPEVARARVAVFNAARGAEYTARYREKNRAALAERHARRRALERKATPPWADAAETAAVYERAIAEGLQVDHVVPLQSKFVCGLHWHGNMRLLTKSKNASKSNRHWPDMP